jgi:hypothetical protein
VGGIRLLASIRKYSDTTPTPGFGGPRVGVPLDSLGAPPSMAGSNASAAAHLLLQRVRCLPLHWAPPGSPGII